MATSGSIQAKFQETDRTTGGKDEVLSGTWYGCMHRKMVFWCVGQSNYPRFNPQAVPVVYRVKTPSYQVATNLLVPATD